MDILNRLEQESGISRKRIEAAVKLLDEGNTVPFIARYRKEVTGSMDDTELRALSSRLEYLRSLERRREEIGALIAAQEKLTPKITEQLAAAETLTELEDIYRPFRPHRKTRASVAKERGLAPLADLIAAQEKIYDPPIEAQAKRFLSAEKGVMSEKEALDGACDILAEEISDDAECRKLTARAVAGIKSEHCFPLQRRLQQKVPQIIRKDRNGAFVCALSQRGAHLAGNGGGDQAVIGVDHGAHEIRRGGRARESNHARLQCV